MDWSAILWAGFIATILATACAWIFRNLRWTPLTPAQQVGCLFHHDPRLPHTEAIGLLVILGAGSAVLPIVYAWALRSSGSVGWAGGLLIGTLAGAAIVMSAPLWGPRSACVRRGKVIPPGLFMSAWGWGTPTSVMVGHAIYGAAFGAGLAAFMAPPG